jgi:hypothetical protein
MKSAIMTSTKYFGKRGEKGEDNGHIMDSVNMFKVHDTHA